MFTLHSHVTEPARERLLEWVRRLAGVESAGQLRPDTKSETVRRMFFVRTSDDPAAVDGVLHALQQSPEVATAESPAARDLQP